MANIHSVIADAGYESIGLSRDLKERNGWKLKIVGLNWVVERSFAWLGRHRRLPEPDLLKHVSPLGW